MLSAFPQGSNVLVLEHIMHCFVVDTTVLQFQCVIWATFAFILSSFFHRRKMHSYLFSSCSNVVLRTKIVFFWYTTPSLRHSFIFKIHQTYDVIFKRYCFNWMNLTIYWCGFRSAFGTAFCIVRFFIFVVLMLYWSEYHVGIEGIWGGNSPGDQNKCNWLFLTVHCLYYWFHLLQNLEEKSYSITIGKQAGTRRLKYSKMHIKLHQGDNQYNMP